LVFRAIPHRAMLMLCHRTMVTSMAHDSDIDDRGKLLCRKEAARYLTALGLVIAPQTLARKYHEGTGPLCTHVGVRAMYWQAHLDAYFRAQITYAAAGSASSKTRVKKSASDRSLSPQAIVPTPSNQAPKEENPAFVATPPPALAPQHVNTAPVATAAPPQPVAEPLAPASATPTKRKKPAAVVPLNQQELPF
jgi:hypothetical protein